MTVAATNAFTGPLLGNGATTAFPFTFEAAGADELAVYVDGVAVASGFTVTLNGGGAGGTVTFAVAPVSGAEILIVSDPDFAQNASFENAGAFLPSTHDAVNDRAAIRDLWLKAQTDRAPKVPYGETIADMPSAGDRASKYLSFDASGNPIANPVVPGAAGPGVGTVAGWVVGLFTAIPATQVPAVVVRLQTTGRSVEGLYSASYKLDPDQTEYTDIGQDLIGALPVGDRPAAQAAITAELSRVRVKDDGDRWWVIDDDAQELHGGHWGMIDGATHNINTGAMTGTDSAPALQAMINWRLYLRAGTPSARKPLRVPSGTFLLNQPIELGYGETYYSYKLQGGGAGFFEVAGQQTILLANFSDQPGLVVHGARHCEISGIRLHSAGSAWVIANNLGVAAGTGNDEINDDELEDWFDPAQPNRDPRNRYKPHAGIAVDPYAGVAPAGAYPSRTAARPAYLPAATRADYGKKESSDVWLEDLWIDGFAVGVAVQPSDYDGNGDFVASRGVMIKHCPLGFSNGNSQARQPAMNRVLFNRFHTMLTNNKHGRQIGQFGGVMADCAASSGINLIDFTHLAHVSPTVFDTWRVEEIHRIGHLALPGQVAGHALRFRACSFNHLHSNGNGNRGVPLYMLGNIGAPTGASTIADLVQFDDDCTFSGHIGLYPMMVHGVRFGGRLEAAGAAGALASQAYARAQNSLAGGLVLPSFERRDRQGLIRYLGRDETTLNALAIRDTSPRNRLSSRLYPASIYTPSLSPSSSLTSQEEIINFQRIGGAGKDNPGWFASTTLVGRTLTFTCAQAEVTVDGDGLIKGAPMLDTHNGMIFIITNRTGSSGAYSYTAELQNGYRYLSTGAIEYEAAFNPALGSFWFAGGGLYTPAYPMFGDLVLGTAQITAIENGAQTNPFTSADIGEGDYLPADPYLDGNKYRNWNKVATGGAPSGAYPASSLTLDGSPLIEPTAWAASTALAVNTRRMNGGSLYRVRVAGTTAASGGPTGVGNAIVDGTVTWEYVGPVGLYRHRFPLWQRAMA